jgi:hypothetical protein
MTKFHIFVGYKFNYNAHATAEGTTCSLIVITTDKKQAYTQRYVITVTGIPSLTTVKRFYFKRESLRLRKEVQFIFELPSHNTLRFLMSPRFNDNAWTSLGVAMYMDFLNSIIVSHTSLKMFQTMELSIEILYDSFSSLRQGVTWIREVLRESQK